MAKKYSDNELQNKPVKELERIKKQLQQSKGRTTPPTPVVSDRVVGRTTPKLSNTQLQSMTVEKLEEVKKDLIRKKSLK